MKRQAAARAASAHFLAGPENRLIEVAVRSVLEGRANGYNPLVLYGASGTGKSHLAQGLAAVCKARRRPGQRVHSQHGTLPQPHVVDGGHTGLHEEYADGKDGGRRKALHAEREEYVKGGDGGRAGLEYVKGEREEYITAEKPRIVCTTAVDFARELADAIETQAVDEFRAKHRCASMLVVEDLGQLATPKSEKLSAQEELVRTIDALTVDGRWVVVTASAPPAELPGIIPMLQSRLTEGLVVRLSPPGPETRLALLRQLAAMRQIDLPDPVAEVLADGVGGTARDLAAALIELAVYGAAGGATRDGQHDFAEGGLDVAAARRYLARRRGDRQPSLHEIALATARHFSLRLSDLKSASRRRALVAARGVAVYLARDVAGQRLEQIGRYFGGRDHTTVLHNYRTTKESLTNDPAIRAAVEQLQAALWKK
ncbi:MAG: DnaA/Hda family protein [Thermoguttaceae bacterium]